MQTPGGEFYLDRLAKAQRLPENQRSTDVQQWLRCHAALDVAFEALPEAQPGVLLSEPAGGQPALLGLLRVLVLSHCEAPADPLHPNCTLRWLGPQLPPLMTVRMSESRPHMQMLAAPLLASIISTNRLPAGPADLAIVARLLLLAHVAQLPDLEHHDAALPAVLAAKHALSDPSSAAGLQQQLSQLQRECPGTAGQGSSSSSGATLRVLSLLDLQVACHLLAFELAEHVNLQRPSAFLAKLCRESAHGLLRLQPSDPRSHFFAAKAAVVAATQAPPHAIPGPKDPVPHLTRGLELARQQGSDLWTARCGYMLAMAAAADRNPAVPPSAAHSAWEEAQAAFQRCRHLIPHNWLKALKLEQQMCSPMLLSINSHLGPSPQRWQAAIAERCMLEQMRQAHRAAEKVEQRATCHGCGLPVTALRKCAGCRQVSYCGRDCQEKHWPQHKAACKAARKAAAAGGA